MNYQKSFGVCTYLSDDLDGAPIKIGSKVRKVNSQKDDIVKDGMQGKVIGSISEAIKIADDMKKEYLYAVIWNSSKSIVVSVVGEKLEVVLEGEEKEEVSWEEVLTANLVMGKRLTENGEVTEYKKQLAKSIKSGGTNFDSIVFILMSKAQSTKENMEKLKRGFPEHFELWWEWYYCGDEHEFFKKYGIQEV